MRFLPTTHKGQLNMRSFKVYGIRQGGAEKWVTNAHTAGKARTTCEMMIEQGYYDEMIIRDALGFKKIQISFNKVTDWE